MALCVACATAYVLGEEELAAFTEASRTGVRVVEETVESREPEIVDVGATATPPSASLPSVVATCADRTPVVPPTGADDCSEPPAKQPRIDSHPGGHTPSPAHHQSCPACLGILEKSFINKLTDSIVGSYEREGYVGVKTFCLALSTPLSLLVRKTSIDLYLQQQRDLPTHPRPITDNDLSTPHGGYVKEELRFQLKASLEDRLSPPLTYNVQSPFQIIVKIDQIGSTAECEVVTRLDSFQGHSSTSQWQSRGRYQARNGGQQQINIVSMTAAIDSATTEDFAKLHMLVPSTPTSECSYEISFVHKPIFIAGRYNKYSRLLPQTPWIVEGVRKAETSLQELIQGDVLKLVKPSELRFSSSGREDVDVRMLGSGRPFLLELLNPRRVCVSDSDLAGVQAAINGSTELVAVHQLQVVDKEASNLLKRGEEEKTKLYSATIWTSQETTPDNLSFLAEIRDLRIYQKTPIRVLHRRSLATRERVIHFLRGEWVDPHHFSLQLSTQAGTYVKEFVHGDFGRTRPSLCELMDQEVDILVLDVEEVALEWPPPVPG